MRIAWTGATPADSGGVPYVATQLLLALARRGVEIDCYVGGNDALPAAVEAAVDAVREPVRWEWDRWYSRRPLAAFVTGQAARARAQRRMADRLAARHAERPYDLVYQFSQIETFALRALGRDVPLVLHPEVHAAGELRWHRSERELAARCESRGRRAAVRTMLTVRSAAQRRAVRRASLVVAPSAHFADCLAADYGIARDALRVVPNPIDLERFRPPAEARRYDGTIRILFASRLAVRKGAELVVELSHRLRDLAGSVAIDVVGDNSQWSDYRPLLAGLEPSVARYVGAVPGPEIPALYASAHLLVQPSHYEPFALTVGEGLASGLPAVVSDAVGAAEFVDRRACATFDTGDVDAFEAAVRRMVDEVRRDGPALAALARAEAERAFDPDAVAAGIVDALASLAPRRKVRAVPAVVAG